jgi:hypothetical protein
MATQNINNYYFNRFDLKLNSNQYFDITLASDEKDYDEEVVFSPYVIAYDDGNRLPISIDLNNPLSSPKNTLYWNTYDSGNTATSLNYYNITNEDLSCYTGFTGLCNVGLTAIDNGLFPRMSGETLYYTMGIDTGTTYSSQYYDRRFKMRPVWSYAKPPNYKFSGITANTVYNIVNKTDDNVGTYQELYGGFFQGFYKLWGYNYEVFPERVNKGWAMETIIKPRQVEEYTLTPHETYLNDVYPQNAGMFFFMGTRAENKFYHPASGQTQIPMTFDCDFDFDFSGATYVPYYRVTSPLAHCIKTCECSLTQIVITGACGCGGCTCSCSCKCGTSCSCGKGCKGCTGTTVADNCFIVYPMSSTTVHHTIGLCGSGYNKKWDYPPVNPGMDVYSNAMAVRLSGDPKNPRLCVKYIKLTGDCVTTGSCEVTGVTYESGYTVNEICSSRGIYDICGYPVSLSERTKERWVMIDVVFERYQYLQDCDLLNEGGLGDIRSLKYTAETVGATVNVIQPPITHCNNTQKEQSYIELNRKWLRQKDDRLGFLKLYINGYLFMIIEDFEEIIPRELNTQKEKQIGVPFNISWGGGTQGLRESLVFNGCDLPYGPYIQDPELMPNNTLSATTLSGSLQTDIVMEQNFGGTFMGGLSQFRMYAEPLYTPQVQHNFRVLRQQFNLFDFWCPNCLEILSQCYFDFNVDLISCDFDFILSEITCDFNFDVI